MKTISEKQMSAVIKNLEIATENLAFAIYQMHVAKNYKNAEQCATIALKALRKLKLLNNQAHPQPVAAVVERNKRKQNE